MVRSHPPSLLTLTERTLRDELGFSKLQGTSTSNGFAKTPHVLVAVSGGVDSMCLLHVLAKLLPRFKVSLSAHGVDHGLRPEATLELDRAEALAQALGVAFSRSKLQLSQGGNLQQRARDVRYRALSEAMANHGATLLATAHHADDRAETVLLRLLRGAGPRGLGVLPARVNDRIRPFLRARRGDIVAHAERHKLPFSDDPSNQNARFLRVRVRHELMPLLAELSPRIIDHLNALADALCADFPEPGAALLGRAQITEIQRAVALGRAGALIAISDQLRLRIERQPASFVPQSPAADEKIR